MASVQSAALLAGFLATQPGLETSETELSTETGQISSQADAPEDAAPAPSAGVLESKLRAAEACRMATLADLTAIGTSVALRDTLLRQGLADRCAKCGLCPDMSG